MMDDAVQRGFILLPMTLVSADENIRKYDVKTLWKD